MNDRNDLVNLFEQHKLTGKGVEVGTFWGEYAQEILKIWTGKLYLIDGWCKFNDDTYQDACNSIDPVVSYTHCFNNIKGHEHRCHMLRCFSTDAVEFFDDESLDFVYIDANHKYDFVKQDLELWYPKVRKGGVFSGHDYFRMNWYDGNFAPNGKDKHIWSGLRTDGTYSFYHGVFGVVSAVDEFCKEKGYTVNTTNEEWVRSWYVIK
jgi:hypothetical protein